MDYNEVFAQWIKYMPEDSPLREELVSLKDNQDKIYEVFYSNLSFGTGGLRGIMGVGSNRMNVYTVAKAASGMAKFLKKRSSCPTVCISYDSRNNSQLFAKTAASVLAENDIGVYLFDTLMPTPVLSFAIRKLKCTGGIMVTASHNPSEYNGFKAYDNLGCQLGDKDSTEIMSYCDDINPFLDISYGNFDRLLSDGVIVMIGSRILSDYLDTITKLTSEEDILKHSDLSVVYTPLHGAGLKPVTELISRLGLSDFRVLECQKEPNGDFPSCPYPNPETMAAMSSGFSELEKVSGDILVSTDPDADRVGVGVLKDGAPHLLSGNEVGILLLDYLLLRRKEKGNISSDLTVISTIVSTPMSKAITEYYGVKYREVLTGFKNIGAVIRELELDGRVDDYLFGFEESCGYLYGSYARDKDGVSALMLILEMAAYYKRQGSSLTDRLDELYEIHGDYLQISHSISFEGSNGMAKMADIMKKLRTEPLWQCCGKDVLKIVDYFENKVLTQKSSIDANLPLTDAISFCFDGENKVIVRPSGTEPKLKIYFLLSGMSRLELLKLQKDLLSDLEQYLGAK